MRLEQILATIPHLTLQERTMVRKALDAANGHAPLESLKPVSRIIRQELTLQENRVVEALRRFMLRRGAEVLIISQLNTDDKFRDSVTALFGYIEKIAINRQQESAMLGLGFHLLYEHMQANSVRFSNLNRAHVMLTAQVLLRRIHLIPTLINRQFPGYASSNTLRWIFKRDSDSLQSRSISSRLQGT